MIPIDEDPRGRVRPALVVPTLLLVCIGIFLWQLVNPALTYTWAAVPWELTNGSALGPVRVIIGGRAVAIPLQPPPAPWMLWLTPLTSMFLHGSWMHLIGNLLYLGVFGRRIEDRLGRLRFLGFYATCGLIACAAHVLGDPASPLPLIGASGAIAGVLGAYARCCPWRRITVLIGILPVALPAILVLGIWFILQWSGLSNPASPIAYRAHIGGFLAGIFLLRHFWPRQG